MTIFPARAVRGSLSVPGDKSISHRYVLLSALADGQSAIEHLSTGADVATTIKCLRSLGVEITSTGPSAVSVAGRGWLGFLPPTSPLDAENSGTTMRLMAGVLAAHPFHSTLVGDESLQRRPMRRVIDPLTAMGATIASDDGRAPLHFIGPRPDAPGGRPGGGLTGLEWTPPVPSAQIKSAVLLAGLYATGETTVVELAPTRDHTERAMPLFGLSCDIRGSRIRVVGGQRATAAAAPLCVPGDPSSAAVWAAAAASLPGSSVQITGVALNPLRCGFVHALRRLGAEVTMTQESVEGGEPVGSIVVTYGDCRDAHIEAAEVPGLIDELPVLAACAAAGRRLEVSGAAELRVKESDRITALVAGFRALGVDAVERPDGFVIDGRAQASGGRADAVGDHRLVMAFAIVGLAARGQTVIDSADSVAVSYPSFEADLHQLIT